MIDIPGLTGAERRLFEDALLTDHKIRTRVDILDRNEKRVGTLNGKIVAGEVIVDSTSDIGRQLQLEILDPQRKIIFDADSPADAAIYADNFLAATYGVYVPALQEWIDVPIFQGPITHYERDGAHARIEASGKESLLLEPALIWSGSPKHFKRGAKVTDAIEKILRGAGETKLDIPDLVKKKVPEDYSLSSHQSRWKACRRLARAIDKQLFYDGTGTARLRSYAKETRYTFRDGAEGIVDVEPQVVYDMEAVRNVIEILGPEPTGKKKRVRGVAVAPAGHPLSPRSLARNGKARFLVESLDEKVRSNQAARRMAKRILDDRLRETLHVSFTCLPIPHLEEGDMVLLDTENVRAQFRLSTFTLPLVADQLMTIGAVTRVDSGSRRS